MNRKHLERILDCLKLGIEVFFKKLETGKYIKNINFSSTLSKVIFWYWTTCDYNLPPTFQARTLSDLHANFLLLLFFSYSTTEKKQKLHNQNRQRPRRRLKFTIDQTLRIEHNVPLAKGIYNRLPHVIHSERDITLNS